MTNSVNIVREDNPHQEFSREELLKNAPKKDSDYFRVPKVIEQAK
jgi:aspartyl-tRNA(Asn)/glutamyl-tRNA(Gln) amidotransferase subunit C